MPAVALHEAERYVAGAYVVLFLLVLVYVAIMAAKLSRIERELGELGELVEAAAEREAAAPAGAVAEPVAR